MDNTIQSNQQLNEIPLKMEAIYNDTLANVKILEQEQKKIINDYLSEKEKEKIEQIRKSLLN